MGRTLVRTGVTVELPEGTYGRVTSRSGLSLNHGIEVGAGTIDRDYKGEIRVLLYNHSNEDFVVKPYDRCAQLIIERIRNPVMKIANSQPKKTERGESSFGSTGIASFLTEMAEEMALSNEERLIHRLYAMDVTFNIDGCSVYHQSYTGYWCNRMLY